MVKIQLTLTTFRVSILPVADDDAVACVVAVVVVVATAHDDADDYDAAADGHVASIVATAGVAFDVAAADNYDGAPVVTAAFARC